MKRVIVLGAGFSRAISDRLPLTDELGTQILRRLKEPDPGFKGGYFEMWLSRLAEAQPDLRDDENYSNYSRFLKITEALHAVMVDVQLAVMAKPQPQWLLDFVTVAHALKITAMTFNYDTLVEKAAEAQQLTDWRWPEPRTAGTDNFIEGLPPLPPRRWGADEIATFRLLKLHGSIDSYWVPGDPTGSTINRFPSLGVWGDPEDLRLAELRRELPGRQPFIVPPAAAKSSFYGNPLTKEVWRSASVALAEADVISLVGYSIPPTDLVSSGMLSDRVAGTDKKVEVVNLYPEEVVKRLQFLGIRNEQLDVLSGTGAVADFARRLESEASKQVAASLESLQNDGSLLLALHEDAAASVVSVERWDSTLRLNVEEIGSLQHATRPQHQRRDGQYPLDLASLEASKGIRPWEQVVVVLPDRQEFPVVDVQQTRRDHGAGTGLWNVFTPAGRLRPEPA